MHTRNLAYISDWKQEGIHSGILKKCILSSFADIIAVTEKIIEILIIGVWYASMVWLYMVITQWSKKGTMCDMN